MTNSFLRASSTKICVRKNCIYVVVFWILNRVQQQMQVVHSINDNDKCKKCMFTKALIESWIIKWMQIVYPTWYRLKWVDMFVIFEVNILWNFICCKCEMRRYKTLRFSFLTWKKANVLHIIIVNMNISYAFNINRFTGWTMDMTFRLHKSFKSN